MRKSHSPRAAALIVGTLALLSPLAIEAQMYGCWTCKEKPLMVTMAQWECDHVGHHENGDGILCEEIDLGSWGTQCFITGGACFNAEVTGEEPPAEEEHNS